MPDKPSWSTGTCRLCGSTVTVISCPPEVSRLSDYLWVCSRLTCANHARPEHTDDQSSPAWVAMP